MLIASPTTFASDCYASYSASSYSVGNWVSATKTTTESATESCIISATGCNPTGYKTTTTTTSETNNYQCTHAVWCNMSGYNPTWIYSGMAWAKEAAECSVSLIRIFYLMRVTDYRGALPSLPISSLAIRSLLPLSPPLDRGPPHLPWHPSPPPGVAGVARSPTLLALILTRATL